MKFKSLSRWCAGALLLGTVAADVGCRRRDPYMDGVMEITRAEKMDLEDQIYALEERLAQREREIESLRGRKPSSTSPANRGLLRDRATTPSPNVMPDEDLVPPAIDPGIPVEPKIELPPIDATPAAPAKPAPKIPLRPASRVSTPPNKLEEAIAPPNALEDDAAPAEDLPPPVDSAVSQASFRKPIASAELEDTRVTTVFINPFQTTGIDLDQQPGDDGIMLLCEPRNEAGQFVPQAGEMTVVVLDPAIEGEAARVARWDLSKNDVAQRILDARPERGVKVQLKWPKERPQHGKLKMFVRYRTTDGRQVEATSDVFISLPGELSQRWTPRQQR